MVTSAELQILQSPITSLISIVSSSVTVKLDYSNYLTWNFQIELLLEGYGLIGFVNGSHSCPTHFVVSNSADSSISSSDVTSACDLWVRLKEQFSIVTQATIFQMKSELQNIKKGTDSISMYLQRIKEAHDHLAAAMVHFNDDDIVILTLNGISSEYNTLRNNNNDSKSYGESSKTDTSPNGTLYGGSSGFKPTYNKNKNKGKFQYNSHNRFGNSKPNYRNYTVNQAPVILGTSLPRQQSLSGTSCQICGKFRHLAPICRHVVFDESEFPYSILSLKHHVSTNPTSKPVFISSSPSISINRKNHLVTIPLPRTITLSNTVSSSADHHSGSHSASLQSITASTDQQSPVAPKIPSGTYSEPNNESTFENNCETSIEIQHEFQPDNLQVILPIPRMNTHSMQTRAKSGISKKKVYLSIVQDTLPVDLSQTESATYKSALKSSLWLFAMEEELHALKVQNTWSLVPLPTNKNLVGCKWVFKLKKHADGSISKNYILNALDDSFYDVYVVCKTANELWESLKKKYKKEDAGGVFIEKLPPSWKEFKNYLKHKRKEMTLEDLIVRLRIEEDNKKNEKGMVSSMEAKANVVEGSSSKQRPKFQKTKKKEKNFVPGVKGKDFKKIKGSC
ncbi:uncharacterized protein [Malus domestica]|uniref:uncharacterized protein n=1 Tax=Malus domestica TaxID=3750 RepID=UPI003976604B